MDLLVLGSSGTYPGADSPASGYLITTERTTIWCDAGPGTFQALAAQTLPERLDAVVLSHLHPDHCTDLFALIHYLAYGPPAGGVTVPVYAPAGAATRFEAFLQPGPEHEFYRVLSFLEAEPGSSVTVGDVAVAFAEAEHSVPAVLTRFSSADRSLVYTGDTGPTVVLEALAADADVLLAEASLAPDDQWVYHMTPAQAGEVAAAAGVDRLILTHLRPTLDPAIAAADAAGPFGRQPLVASPGLRMTV